MCWIPIEDVIAWASRSENKSQGLGYRLEAAAGRKLTAFEQAALLETREQPVFILTAKRLVMVPGAAASVLSARDELRALRAP
jgi:hypothetical protein